MGCRSSVERTLKNDNVLVLFSLPKKRRRLKLCKLRKCLLVIVDVVDSRTIGCGSRTILERRGGGHRGQRENGSKNSVHIGNHVLACHEEENEGRLTRRLGDGGR